MSISERQTQILSILKERNYISVHELAQLTFTSPSSIRRDLTSMQNIGLVERSHGGVTLPEPVRGLPSLFDRMTKNVPQKRIIAKKASSLLRNGQTIMLDGSSTASFLVPYIARLDGAVLFTNNMTTAIHAIELGIDTHVIGGHCVGNSGVLSGFEACRAVSSLHPDLLFFSSQSLSSSGIISDSVEGENYLRTLMIAAAKKTVFLCDSEKFGTQSTFVLSSLNQIDLAFFDKPYPELRTHCQIL